jgi:predicted dehydrogenase
MSGWKTVLVGFGQIAAGLAEDPVHARAYPYATHAQALRDHPAFDWVAVVDPVVAAREMASTLWGIGETAASVQALASAQQIEVAVIATPPTGRLAILDALPRLKAVLVEKPLADSMENAEAFLAYCQSRNIAVLVCLPRHYDMSLRQLARGGLTDAVGMPMAVFATYGNGLANNGMHLLDMIRFLLGEISSVQATAGATSFVEGPLDGDLNLPFTCLLANGLTVMVNPLRFFAYREVGLDIWGQAGRLQILHESLTLHRTCRKPSRILSDAAEIDHDNPSVQTSTVGHALYAVYDNLSGVLQGAAPFCGGDDALATMRIIAAVRRSAVAGGTPEACN